ncbi:MAG: acyl-CoA thioester hydrolase/BAAT C-terminal domain-containing protein [Eubacteriales bacterium]|nr:acyl-CoA thioester hydrolase/BAAT C-terminal domain-containing protein [Eubacteriales bacterium]
MKGQHFSNEADGFYGIYFKNQKPSKCAVIAMLGDDAGDYLAKRGAKWLMSFGLNVMTMSPAKKSYNHVNYPIERIGAAVQWLRTNGNQKVGILGMSTTGMSALAAASYYPEITLTIALTPSDFVWQGFEQGKKDGVTEWPIPNASTLSWQGKALAYMPFVYQHPEYGRKIIEETKGSGDMIRSTWIFNDSEKANPLTEEQMIKVENIKGRLFLVAAEDDSFWNTAKYVRRMDERLKNRPHDCEYQALVYQYGTHFVIPESFMKSIAPFSKQILKFVFRSAKEHPKECRQTRIDIEKHLSEEIKDWMA